ncbi:MAG: cupin domain-containing protein [Solirubrobacteraceae bacterium]
MSRATVEHVLGEVKTHANDPRAIALAREPVRPVEIAQDTLRGHPRVGGHTWIIGYRRQSAAWRRGARTAWHTHPFGQTIYVTEGIGFCQRQGGSIEVIRAGDRVFFEPAENHWHGAAPDRFMTHLAIQQVDEEGNAVTWGEHVTEAEYTKG